MEDGLLCLDRDGHKHWFDQNDLTDVEVILIFIVENLRPDLIIYDVVVTCQPRPIVKWSMSEQEEIDDLLRKVLA